MRAPSLTCSQPSSLPRPRGTISLKLAATLAVLAACTPASALQGVLYGGPGYEIVQVAPGELAPVGYMNPYVAYTLPHASSGGQAAGAGMGVVSATLSSTQAFLGPRAIVISSSGSTVLGTLGSNSVDGWTPIGAASATAVAVNSSGLIVGSSTLYAADGSRDFGGRAVYWTAGSTTPQQLAMPAGFTDPNGAGFASATGVSSTGIVIGQATQYDGSSSRGTRSLRWNSVTGQAEVLGKLPGYSEWGDNNSWAVAVNAAGAVVGGGNTFDAQGRLLSFSAIRWNAGSTEATALGNLGTDKQGFYLARALAINDAGTAVGHTEKYDANHNFLGDAAVRWDAGQTVATELHGLGTGTDGIAFNHALAINASGTVGGVSHRYAADGRDLGSRAVLWRNGSTTATELGLLSQGLDGTSFSYLFGLNASGYAVGMANVMGNSNSSPNSGAVHAVVWTPDGDVIDLNSLLPGDSRWVLTGAYAISDSGWITGVGLYQPEGYDASYAYQRAFGFQLAAVPEPTTGVLLAAGLAALVWRRRRQLAR